MVHCASGTNEFAKQKEHQELKFLPKPRAWCMDGRCGCTVGEGRGPWSLMLGTDACDGFLPWAYNFRFNS
eukprot:727278-Karenia_brevis.AAC.1